MIAYYEGAERLTELRRKVAAYSESLNKQRAVYKRTLPATPPTAKANEFSMHTMRNLLDHLTLRLRFVS